MDISVKSRPTLVVMVKEPRPGRVKTRLGSDIGMTASAWWFRHQTASLLRRLKDRRWKIELAVSPDKEGLTSRVWPHELPRRPQWRGDLGQRMVRQLCQTLGPVCVIGGDIPDIQKYHVHDCFRQLGSNDLVFGPAYDGGFWLIGTKGWPQMSERVFDGVRWSTEHALADTIACLDGKRIGYGPRLSDVDSVADLRK